jgi:hypothetical protein
MDPIKPIVEHVVQVNLTAEQKAAVDSRLGRLREGTPASLEEIIAIFGSKDPAMDALYGPKQGNCTSIE